LGNYLESKFQRNQDYRQTRTGLAAELHLMLVLLLTAFDIYCGETRFDSLHLDLLYTQRIKVMTSSRIAYHLGIQYMYPLCSGSLPVLFVPIALLLVAYDLKFVYF
jgi:hypothetical protein